MQIKGRRTRFLEPVFYKSVRFPAYPHTFASGSLATLILENNNIGDAGAKAIADAIGASGSLALKKLFVDDKHLKHKQLVAACKSKGVELR